nr:IS256 family transposase [Candidatus Palauibacterales bacterium]
WTEEGTVTRVEQSRELVDWAQSVLASDGDLLSEVLRLGLERLMEAEQTAYVNAERHERTEGRRTQRNGYRTRTLKTRAGELELEVPRTRDGEFYPFLLQRYQRSEKALVAALAECYVQGVSTRRVSEICEELFDGRVSHETVSRYVQQLDEELEPWRTRDLEGTEFPYLIVDARYEKARVDGRIVDVALLVAVGVDEDGYRQVLGVDTAYGETEQTWSDFLGGLRERGLSGVQLVVSDDHAGLGRARREHFPGVPWQRCQRHFLQNALERAPARLEDELHERLRAVWDEPETHEEAREALRSLARQIAEKEELPELAEWLEVEGEETLSCFRFPSTHRLRIRTTNGMERLNQEIKRRSRVVRIFPNPESCRRLAAARLKEHHED